jgi:hypothetical protein
MAMPDIEKVQDYIKKNYEGKITIKDLANLGACRRTF